MRHRDPLRARHTRARHRLRKNVRATAPEQALRLRDLQRLHPTPARREAGRHLVLAPEVMNMPPRNNTQAPNNLYN